MKRQLTCIACPEGCLIEVETDGNLKENPVLDEDAALSLVKKFVGG